MYEKSIEMLNHALADELTAVHQYMYFHFHCDDQGFDLLAKLFERTAIEEMKHVEKLGERILFLKGDVDMKLLHEIKKVQDVPQMLEIARGMEESSIKDYNRFALDASHGQDAATKQIFEALIADEERHFNNWDNEVENIRKYGDRYLALQSMERSRSAAGGSEA